MHGFVQDLALSFAAALSEGKFGDVSDSKLKLASQIAAGHLDRHPVIHGMLIATLEKCKREDRGLSTMRNNQCNEEELALVKEAGTALACMGANKSALKMFSKRDLVTKTVEDVEDLKLRVQEYL